MTHDVPQSAEVVICGAGIAGVSTAYFLTEMGVKDIALVDKQAPLMLTTDKSVESYRNWWADEVMARFMDHSIDLLERFADESGNSFNMNRRGYAWVTTRDDKAAQYRDDAHAFDERGFGPIRVYDGTTPDVGPYVPPALEGFEDAPPGADLLLDRDAIREAFPYLGDDVKAVLNPRRCGWLSAQQLGMYWLDEARARGVRVLRGEVVGVEQDAQGVSAVQVGEERIETRRLVNAAGPFLGHVGAMLGVDLPIHNELHQKVVFQDLQGVIPRNAPLVILDEEPFLEWSEEEQAFWEEEPDYRWMLDRLPTGCHFRPEGTGESPWLLLAWGVQIEPTEPTWGEPAYSPEYPEVVLRGACKLAPGLKQYVGRMPNPVMHDGGFYTKTRENRPLIGPLGVDGGFVVGALSGFGVMASSAAGELAATWVTGGDLPDYAASLVLQRYDDPAYAASIEGMEAGEI